MLEPRFGGRGTIRGDSGRCTCCSLGFLGYAALIAHWLVCIVLPFIPHSGGGVCGHCYEVKPFSYCGFISHIDLVSRMWGPVLWCFGHNPYYIVEVFCQCEVGQFHGGSEAVSVSGPKQPPNNNHDYFIAPLVDGSWLLPCVSELGDLADS